MKLIKIYNTIILNSKNSNLNLLAALPLMCLNQSLLRVSAKARWETQKHFS